MVRNQPGSVSPVLFYTPNGGNARGFAMAATAPLCDLITGHLLPFLESNTARPYKETEKDLLISLTRVRREIQQMITKSSSEAEEMIGSSYANHYCCPHLQDIFKGEEGCLCHIITSMVAFLSGDSHFVRHAAGTILLSISHFLIKADCLWVKFLRLIWFILEASMSTICSRSVLSAPAVIHVDESLMMLYEPTFEDLSEDQALQFARFIALLKSRSLNVNLFIVVHLFQTLRNILKSVKHGSSELEEVFTQFAVSSLIRMPWNLLFGIFGNCCYTSQTGSGLADILDIRRSLTGMKNLLLGTVLQLTCCLVKAYDLEADGSDPLKDLAVYSKFTDLVPKLISCYFIDHLGNSFSIYGYLRHKSLNMMIRLSFHRFWKNSYPESWLKILDQFFGEALHQSIPGFDAGSEICLESSPFFVSAPDGDKSYPRHLQRQVIFLLFKCSFTIAKDDKVCKECSCTKGDGSTSLGLQICKMHCQLGLKETFIWLERCCDLDKVTECKNYSESCSTFALSFLQFYMEEDDMLFKMLLQLLDVPFSTLHKEFSSKDDSIQENKDILHHYSSIFCPIRLFHLFLLLLHYDHLVLVDYLISKDTGIQCLQYLLRCIHMIYMTWPAFRQFSVSGNGHHYQKRRKIAREDGPTPLSSTTVAFHRKIIRRHQSTNATSNSHTFEKARQCLLSLKISLEELQRKSLFPYNPKPLLKSLSRFQELCMTNNPLQT